MARLTRLLCLCGVGALSGLFATAALAASEAETAASATDTRSSDQPPGASTGDVTITGYRITRGSVGSLVDAPLEDVPRGMVALDEETLENQLVDSTRDIFKLFAGVQRGSEGPGGEHPRVRGQYAFQFLEGTFSGGPIWDSAEFFSSAELMNGPSSLQFGFQSLGGGAINYRLKRPSSASFLEATLEGTNWGGDKVVLDGNMPFQSAPGDGVRVIGIHEDIRSYQRGIEDGDRNALSLMLTYSGIAGIKAELDGQLIHRSAPREATIGFTANPTSPVPALDPRNLLDQRWADTTVDARRFAARLIREFAGDWRATFTASWEGSVFEDTYCSVLNPNLQTGEGSYSCSTAGGFPRYTNRSFRLDVGGTFETFGFKHAMTFGGSQLRQHVAYGTETTYNFSFDAEGNPVPPYAAQNIYDPRQYPYPSPASETPPFGGRETLRFLNAYIQDRMSLTDRLDLWLGVNRASEVVDCGSATGLTECTNAKGFSPSASISYGLAEHARAYFTYADTLAPGGKAPSDPRYINAGEQFAAIRQKSYEIGTKWRVGLNTQLNANLFRTTESAEITEVLGPNGTPDSLRYTQNGLDVFKGFEFSGTTKLDWGLDASLGFIVMKPEQKETGTPAYDDKYVPGVSRQSVTFNADYTLPAVPKLTLTGGAYYASSTPLLPQNGYDLPGYTLVDFGGRYEASVADVPVTIRLRLDNAFDKRYFSPYVSSFLPGAPRTLTLAVTARLGSSK